MADAQWTRATYMSQARAQADAASSDRWSDTDVKYALGLVHTREWKRILNANNVWRYAQRTIAQDSTGLITLASLDSGTGDSQQRAYRVLDVAQDATVYNEIRFADAPTAVTVGGFPGTYVWYRVGTNIQILPAQSGVSMTVWVNHLPTPIDQLSLDTVAVEFPRDYESLIAYETAAWLLVKGGAETDSAHALQQMAEQIRGDMLGDLTREGIAPIRMSYPDRASAWGG